MSPFEGPIAQRLEQATHNRLVVGSIPTGPTISVAGSYVKPHELIFLSGSLLGRYSRFAMLLLGFPYATNAVFCGLAWSGKLENVAQRQRMQSSFCKRPGCSDIGVRIFDSGILGTFLFILSFVRLSLTLNKKPI